MKKLFEKTIFIAGFILPFVFLSCNSTNLNGTKCDFTRLNEETEYLTLKVSYPNFRDYPDFSNKIRNNIENDINKFKPEAEKQWNKINSLNTATASALPPYEYLLKSAVSTSENIISVYTETYKYAGGAHGETSIKTYNYDKTLGKEVNITEATGYSYKQLSDICRKQLYEKLISENKDEMDQGTVELLDEMIEEGTKALAGNFKNFSMCDNSVKIFFEQYKVAPYSYGSQTVDIEL